MVLLLLTVLVSTAVGTNSYCMADYSGPSLYEQICCQVNNLGKTRFLHENDHVKLVHCSSTRPVSCPGKYFYFM